MMPKANVSSINSDDFGFLITIIGSLKNPYIYQFLKQ
jgi:hypothetical protein